MYKFGKINLDFNGSSKTFVYLEEEFSILPKAEQETQEVKVTVIECNDLPKREDYITAGSLKAGQNFICGEQSYYKYMYESDGNSHTVYIQLKPKRLKRRVLPSVVESFLEASNLNFPQLVAKSIIYGCLDFIIQQVQLKQLQSFVHTSTISNGTDTLAFLAWGGVGKTTALLKLMQNNDFDFLSDDLGIITSDGLSFRNPKKMQVYAYNMQGEGWLEDKLLQGRSFLDKLLWNMRLQVFGKNKVRRRVFPEELFSGKEGIDFAKITKAIYLERTDSKEFSFVSLPKEHIAKKAAYVLIEELKPFATISSYYKSSFPDGKLVLSCSEMEKYSFEIISQWLTEADTVGVLSIPLQASPQELYDYIKTVNLI